jgi:ATP-binding cassette subfamily F protein 3
LQIIEFLLTVLRDILKTDAVQSRVKMLDKLVIVEVDEVDTSALKLKFPLRFVQDISVIVRTCQKPMESCSFKDTNIVIERGQKVAFVGKNGEEIDND